MELKDWTPVWEALANKGNWDQQLYEIGLAEQPYRILDEEILYQQGSFSRVRQWIAGWHPELGVLTEGWSGRETVLVKELIEPIQVIEVI